MASNAALLLLGERTAVVLLRRLFLRTLAASIHSVRNRERTAAPTRLRSLGIR